MIILLAWRIFLKEYANKSIASSLWWHAPYIRQNGTRIKRDSPELYWVYCWYWGWKLWNASVIMSLGFIVSWKWKNGWIIFLLYSVVNKAFYAFCECFFIKQRRIQITKLLNLLIFINRDRLFRFRSSRGRNRSWYGSSYYHYIHSSPWHTFVVYANFTFDCISEHQKF